MIFEGFKIKLKTATNYKMVSCFTNTSKRKILTGTGLVFFFKSQDSTNVINRLGREETSNIEI